MIIFYDNILLIARFEVTGRKFAKKVRTGELHNTEWLDFFYN
jgi:hypothetical protein